MNRKLLKLMKKLVMLSLFGLMVLMVLHMTSHSKTTIRKSGHKHRREKMPVHDELSNRGGNKNDLKMKRLPGDFSIKLKPGFVDAGPAKPPWQMGRPAVQRNIQVPRPKPPGDNKERDADDPNAPDTEEIEQAKTVHKPQNNVNIQQVNNNADKYAKIPRGRRPPPAAYIQNKGAEVEDDVDDEIKDDQKGNDAAEEEDDAHAAPEVRSQVQANMAVDSVDSEGFLGLSIKEMEDKIFGDMLTSEAQEYQCAETKLVLLSSTYKTSYGVPGFRMCMDGEVAPRPPCLVYSAGRNHERGFDLVFAQTYQCEVVSIDQIYKGANVPRIRQIKADVFRTDVDASKMTLKTLRRGLKQSQKVVDAMKIEVLDDMGWRTMENIVESRQMSNMKQFCMLLNFNVQPKQSTFLVMFSVLESMKRKGMMLSWVTTGCARRTADMRSCYRKTVAVCYINERYTEQSVQVSEEAPGNAKAPELQPKRKAQAPRGQPKENMQAPMGPTRRNVQAPRGQLKRTVQAPRVQPKRNVQAPPRVQPKRNVGLQNPRREPRGRVQEPREQAKRQLISR